MIRLKTVKVLSKMPSPVHKNRDVLELECGHSLLRAPRKTGDPKRVVCLECEE